MASRDPDLSGSRVAMRAFTGLGMLTQRRVPWFHLGCHADYDEPEFRWIPMRFSGHERERPIPSATLHLRRFLPHYAGTVAGWVADDRELFWVAPSTESPLTAEKVLGWTQDRGSPLVISATEDETPIGYAELNPLRKRPDHCWIGHVIIAPNWRGRGFGAAFMRLVLEHAFHELHAARVSLIVFPDNCQAVRCYVNAGFTIHDEQYHNFGRPERSYRMHHLVCANPARPEGH
ncbi:MAG: GNAT family N-acetyltransferase [Planctomycetota bacterium]